MITTMHYVTRFCGTIRPRPFLRLSSTIPSTSKTAVQKSKGVSRPSLEVQCLSYLLVGARLGPGSIIYRFARTAPSRFTDSESMAPQPIDKNAIDRPLGRATPLERFFFQYPKFQYKPSESPISEFKRLCKVYEQNARHRLDIAVNQARDVRGFWNKLGNVVSQPKVHPLGGVAPLEMFFAQYPKFRYDPSKSPVAEFNRLWKEYERDTRHKFNAAIKREFYDLYGTDEKNTNNWHKLCRALRIDPIPDTRKECRAVSCHLFVPSDLLT